MAKDSISQVIELDCPVLELFEKFQDVKTVSGFLPILSELKEIAPLQNYVAVLEDRVGPFKLRADLSIETKVDRESMRFSVEARGEDRQVRSAIRISVSMHFAPISDARTRVAIEGTYEVSGKVATLGSSVIKSKANKLTLEFANQVRENFGG